MMDNKKDFNALLVGSSGSVKQIYIENFKQAEIMGAPLDCQRIHCVSTGRMHDFSRKIGCIIVGYVDANGDQKGLLQNKKMCEFVGYSHILGDCVLCGWESGDYAPLESEDVERIYQILIGEKSLVTDVNAVLIRADDTLEMIHVDDFDTEKGLSKPLNCSGIKRVMTNSMHKISLFLHMPVVGYVDAEGSEKNLPKNQVMCELAHCETLVGDFVLCGRTENGYKGLTQEAAEKFYSTIKKIVKDTANERKK